MGMEGIGAQEIINWWINIVEYWLFKMVIMCLVFKKYVQLKCIRVIIQKMGGVNITQVFKILGLSGKQRKKFVITWKRVNDTWCILACNHPKNL